MELYEGLIAIRQNASREWFHPGANEAWIDRARGAPLECRRARAEPRPGGHPRARRLRSDRDAVRSWGSDSEIDSFRVKLWRAYLVGQGAADPSSAHIDETIAQLRSEMVNDATDELRRQYRSARAAIPDVTNLSPEELREFYGLCESPRIRGAPP